MNSIERPRLAVRSPADLVAAVPYLLGFHPADSVVVVAMRGRRVVFAARGDLPEPGSDPGPAARHLADVVARQRTDAATVLGYGPAARVTGTVEAVGEALDRAGLLVLDALRVTDGRWWSYLCAEPACCPPEGTRYDPAASQVSAAAVFAGQVALPDRAALAAQVAPIGGPVRLAMHRATTRARHRLNALAGATAGPAEEADGRAGDAVGAGPVDARAVRSAGVAAVRTAFRRHRRGERLGDDEVAWLTVLLTHLPVRDHAWSRTDGRDADISLWTDVLRRAEPELIAAPGSLLAFAAWRAGHGALAAVALERVLAAHPGYSLALLLDDALRRGLAPSELDGWPVTAGRAVLRPRRRRPRR
ncbi:DUF4192 family protein [Micromonospora terminaliae]|uniref:DUF4192 domain-containing protein n=1 Tax=Micromonospora terminaliae TaxID=1914461 RepID=A0AAJ2ZHF3_9ACTN|nr:DUF4192 domain-containing protein [Micromonospora terminaliae]NES29775.1 DUF4192 domain-containing protein [Micromonospora terminaliae]QGL50037.1 DUF4192 family protein [Micromonospora terminaliae]